MKISEFLQAAQGPKIGKKKVTPLAFLTHYRDWLMGFPGIRSKIETCFRWLDKSGPKQPNEHPTPTLAYIMGLISTERDVRPPPVEKEKKQSKVAKAARKEEKEKKPKKPYVIIISVKDDPYNEGKWELGMWNGNHRYEDETQTKRVYDKDSGLPVWKEVQANYFMAATYQEAMGLCDRKLDQNENAVFGEIIGHGVNTKIHRSDAVSRVNAKKKGAATKRVAKVSASLGWGPRSHDYKQHFSHG